MATAKKAEVTIERIYLAATAPVVWRFTTGVQPYVAKFSVITEDWEKLEKKIGKPVTLKIKDARGKSVEIKELFILHVVPSSRPKITSFVVADRRWRWPRTLVARTYNMTRSTGDKAFGQTLPPENAISIPIYDYKVSSLNKGEEKWTAKEALKDLLEQVEEDFKEDSGGAGGGSGGGSSGGGEGGGGGKVNVEDMPTTDEFTLQNLVIRDQGDAAVAAMLSRIPGADIWIDGEGNIKVVNTLNLDAVESYIDTLPPSTWDGEKHEKVDRKAIRPKNVRVHYEREIEVLLEYKDDFGSATSSGPKRDEMYLDNVIPTTDVSTEVFRYDPETDKTVKVDVPAGTFVEVQAWLEAMDKIKPSGSLPWDFDVVKYAWISGNLKSVWSGSQARNRNEVDESNVFAAIGAFMANFRQTFRINSRYMQRINKLKAVQVGVLDPVQGTRVPSGVWGEICLLPSRKGWHLFNRKNEGDHAGTMFNIRTLPPFDNTGKLSTPGPQRVQMIDAEAGIFHVTSSPSAYGSYDAMLPCHVNDGQIGAQPSVNNVDLKKQDIEALGAEIYVQGGSEAAIALSNKMELNVIMTLVPGSPNNKTAFHEIAVAFDDVKDKLHNAEALTAGDGPPVDVFVPVTEKTARFQIIDPEFAFKTTAELFGLLKVDPIEEGWSPLSPDDTGTTEDPSGYALVNAERDLKDHAESVAAEVWSTYADTIQGSIATQTPSSGKLKIVGNMGGAVIQVSAAPSSKVSTIHDFAGVPRRISRLATMEENTRKLVLGIVPLT